MGDVGRGRDPYKRHSQEIRRWGHTAESVRDSIRCWSHVLLVAGCSPASSQQISFEFCGHGSGLCRRRQDNVRLVHRLAHVIHVNPARRGGRLPLRPVPTSFPPPLCVGRILEETMQPGVDMVHSHVCHGLLKLRACRSKCRCVTTRTWQRACRRLLPGRRARSWQYGQGNIVPPYDITFLSSDWGSEAAADWLLCRTEDVSVIGRIMVW